MKRDEAITLVQGGIRDLNEALKAGRSETLERYLSVMSRFHRYSFGNLVLILSQREDAVQVAGFNKWKKLGRTVKKGEKGIGIFAPCRYRKQTKDENGDEAETTDIRGFKVVHVFDVSQTEGDALPEFAAVTGDPGAWLYRLEEVARRRGIAVEYVDHLFGALGASSGGTVRLLRSLKPAEKCLTLAHEICHEEQHHGARKHDTTKTVRETEAEAVGFVVSRAIGLDATTHCADYIQLYRGNPDVLAESLHIIQKTAAGLIDALGEVEVPCDHTLHHRDAQDALQGSWTEISAEHGTRIECRYCGRFYGYQLDISPEFQSPLSNKEYTKCP